MYTIDLDVAKLKKRAIDEDRNFQIRETTTLGINTWSRIERIVAIKVSVSNSTKKSGKITMLSPACVTASIRICKCFYLRFPNIVFRLILFNYFAYVAYMSNCTNM